MALTMCEAPFYAQACTLNYYARPQGMLNKSCTTEIILSIKCVHSAINQEIGTKRSKNINTLKKLEMPNK